MKKLLFLLLLFATAQAQTFVVNPYILFPSGGGGSSCGTVAANNGAIDDWGGTGNPNWNGLSAGAPTAISATTTTNVSFAGQRGKVSLTSDITIGTTASFSIWFYMTSVGTMTMMSDGVNNTGTYVVVDDATHIRFSAATDNQYFTVPTMSSATWYNLIIVRNSGTTHLYLNGTESSTGGIAQSNDFVMRIFGQYGADANYIYLINWLGALTDLSVWNGYALSSGDISSIQAGGHPSTYPACLTTHLPMNENTGTTLNDTH